MIRATAMIVGVLVLTLTGTAAADNPKPERTRLLDARTVTLRGQAREITQARASAWACQDKLGVERTIASAKPWALPRSTAYRGWTARLWQKRTRACERQLERLLPSTGDWQTAVAITQRVYPGTSSWLLSCSGAEGGHGIWVWYGGSPWRGYHIGGDTVGGWLQFRYSTFAPYWRSASADVARRGFIIPNAGDGYAAWLDPLDHALTGGYMRYHGLTGSHWSASWGNGC